MDGQAIRAHGGSGAVAAELGWDAPVQKKPRGYWDDILNLKVEIDAFIAESGLPPGRMPAKTDFVRAGRYDMARAVERWGGIQEVADALNYPLVRSSALVLCFACIVRGRKEEVPRGNCGEKKKKGKRLCVPTRKRLEPMIIGGRLRPSLHPSELPSGSYQHEYASSRRPAEACTTPTFFLGAIFSRLLFRLLNCRLQICWGFPVWNCATQRPCGTFRCALPVGLKLTAPGLSHPFRC